MSTHLQQISQQIRTLPMPEQKRLSVWLDELLGQKIQENGNNIRKQVTDALHDAGLCATPGPSITELAEASNVTLSEVQEMFRQAGGQPLSELVLELRGPKE